MYATSNRTKHSRRIRHSCLLLTMLLILTVACTANYGHLQRSNDVSKVFERHEVLADG